MAGGLYRAWSLAAVLAASVALPSFAQQAAEGGIDLTLEALPEVEVRVPADRTEFSPVAAPELIAPPQLPEVVVAVPDVPVTVPLPPAVIVAIPDTPPMPPRLSGTPEPAISAEVEPAPASPQIAIAPPPERRPAAPVAEPPKATLPVVAQPASAPIAEGPATLDRTLIDTAFDTVWRGQGLPNPVMQGVKAYYEAPENAPIWTSASGLSARAKAALAVIDQGAEHGLDPSRNARLRQLVDSGTPEVREIAMSVLAALYARDARGGRINPQLVSKLITATPTLPDTEAVLIGLRVADDAGKALEEYNPRHAGYQALKQHLARLRAAPDVTGSLEPEETLRNGRKVKREAPNPVADVIANMERWRWLPVDLGDDHVFVNVPSYSLTLRRDRQAVLATRVIVGKPNTPTPIFSDKMQFLVVNPYWNVPPSIALKEYLPLLQKNPQALQARGLQVVSRGKVVDPATADWSKIGRSVAIRQPPGERNALGHIKFMFPNQHAVYLHDTPGRGLFARDTRAFSHGCVRVENPFRLAEAVLGQGWSEGRLRSMVGGPERQIGLNEHLPVHLAYFTTVVDEAGEVKQFADIYGHNRRVRSLLGL